LELELDQNMLEDPLIRNSLRSDGYYSRNKQKAKFPKKSNGGENWDYLGNNNEIRKYKKKSNHVQSKGRSRSGKLRGRIQAFRNIPPSLVKTLNTPQRSYMARTPKSQTSTAIRRNQKNHRPKLSRAASYQKSMFKNPLLKLGTPTKRKTAKRRRSLMKGRHAAPNQSKNSGNNRKKLNKRRSRVESFLGNMLVHKTIGVTDSFKFDRLMKEHNFSSKNKRSKKKSRMYNRDFHTFNLNINTSPISDFSDEDEKSLQSAFGHKIKPKSVKATMGYGKRGFGNTNLDKQNNLTLNSNFLNRMKNQVKKWVDYQK